MLWVDYCSSIWMDGSQVSLSSRLPFTRTPLCPAPDIIVSDLTLTWKVIIIPCLHIRNQNVSGARAQDFPARNH